MSQVNSYIDRTPAIVSRYMETSTCARGVVHMAHFLQALGTWHEARARCSIREENGHRKDLERTDCPTSRHPSFTTKRVRSHEPEMSQQVAKRLYNEKVQPTTLLPKQVGNMYTASLYAAFASLIHEKHSADFGNVLVYL
ncbi:hypothetical protein Scep_002565 [Stephania cephalantha]|uniref:Hydroxymethylglutaryl-coenzyme A synthase C-terminal domain-containing protein n=1 Tax=Stephania cephalantha TaxID=152367 RepID=A0AAP0LEV3_9MAGN